MPLPRAITGGAPLELGGGRWWLRITHRVLLACEEETGVELLEGGPAIGEMPARLLRSLLRETLQEEWGRVAAMLTTLPAVSTARRAMIAAWSASMPDPSAAPVKSERLPPEKPLTWPEAWASATSRYELGLTDEQWLEMTPRQVEALRRVRLRAMQREELLNGLLAATVANFGARAPARAMRAESFMLHPFEAQPEEQGPVTGETIMAMLAPIKAELRKRGS
jgi:hypothetical protein